GQRPRQSPPSPSHVDTGSKESNQKQAPAPSSPSPRAASSPPPRPSNAGGCPRPWAGSAPVPRLHAAIYISPSLLSGLPCRRQNFIGNPPEVNPLRHSVTLRQFWPLAKAHDLCCIMPPVHPDLNRPRQAKATNYADPN